MKIPNHLLNEYDPNDILQMEEVADVVKIYKNDERISTKKALQLLGENEFWSGIGRCAFHASAVRYDKENNTYYFDNYAYFNFEQ